jgi:diguanylate cyclase (GGDEF)-like protein
MLDFPTVFIFSGSLMFFVCVVTGLAWWAGEAGSESRYWFDASLMQLVGAIVLAAGNHVPLAVGTYVAGISLTASTGFLTLGYRQLYGLDARVRWPLLVTAVTGLAIFLVRTLSGGSEDGLFVVYAGASINLCIGALAVWRGSRSEGLRFGQVAAWMLVGHSAAYFVASVFALFFPVRIVDGEPHSLWLEVSTLPLVLLNLGAYFMTLIVKLERATERQRHLAAYDVLTGVLNRRAFHEAWSKELTRGGVLAVLDIDHFKSVNDTHGHHAGDIALKTFAATIAAALPKGTVFGRLGGEEFAILFPATQAAVAGGRLEALRPPVAANVIQSCEGKSFSITFSGGYVAFEGIDTDFDRIFAAADCALYAAKTAGRDRIVAFEPHLLLRDEARLMRGTAPVAQQASA